MKKSFGWLLLALPLVVAGCGGAEEAEDVELAADTTAALAPVDAAPAGALVVVALEPVGAAGATGQATLTPQGEQTQVQIQLSGLTAGEHPGHIHGGTCAAPGPVVQPLPTIVAAADGAGAADTVVAIAAATVQDGQHIVQYHGEGGAPVACAAVPAGAI